MARLADDPIGQQLKIRRADEVVVVQCTQQLLLLSADGSSHSSSSQGTIISLQAPPAATVLTADGINPFVEAPG